MKEQHAVLRKKTTTTALDTLMPILQKIIDSRGHVAAFFLGYTKAFDSINLDLFFVKLQAYGVEECLLRFLQSFLMERTQRVMINCATSDAYETLSGIPQDTCLGPLIFPCT